MKNLKYIKLFEAFESKKLSKTLGYVKSNKNQFLEDVKTTLRSIDFPESKISDDYIEYLPFNKALKKADIITDEPCDATSGQAFPDFEVEGAKCEDGKMARKWGRNIRKVECPVCGGTGIKPKRPGDIKMVKFWFSKDGEYITKSAVDGIVRESKGNDKQLSNDLSDYRIGRRVSKENLLKLDSGTFALINIEGRDTICYIFKTSWTTYALQYRFDGDTPGYSAGEWRNIAPYSWALGGSDHSGGKLLYPVENKDKEPNPYTWNVPLQIRWGNLDIITSRRGNQLKDLLKNAHFALVLDFAKLKKSGFDKKQDIKSKRDEIKKGAFLTDEEVRNQNIKRYIDQISKSMDIVSDVSNINKLLKRLLGYKYALFNIVSGNSKDTLSSIIGLYYDLLKETNEEQKKYLIERIESYVKRSVNNLKESNLPKNIEYVKNKLVEAEKETHLKLLDELIKLSGDIYDKVKKYDVETIEDLEVMHQKLLSINNLFGTRRYAASNLKYFFDALSSSSGSRAYDRFGSSYYGVDDAKAEEIIKELDRIKNIISKI